MDRRKAAALRRLALDLREIQKNPVPGVSAAPINDDLFKWHCNLVGPAGTVWDGAIFHLELAFPQDYPNASPSLTMCTSLPHSYVHGNKVCMSILSDFGEAHPEWANQKSHGWSSAYTIHTILLQLQSFLLDDVNSRQGSPVEGARREAANFSCADCAHKPGAPFPALTTQESQKPAAAAETAATTVTTTTAAPAAAADDPEAAMRELMRAAAAKIAAEVARIEADLLCYHSRQSHNDDVLGIGVTVQRHRDGGLRALGSPLDLLSRTSFFETGIRESAFRENFTEWLPLYISADHGERALPLLRASIARLARNIELESGGNAPDVGAGDFRPEQCLEVLPALMTSMIVSVLDGKMHASIKALEGFCLVHRLLLFMLVQHPELQREVDARVEPFVRQARHRHKDHTPNLGNWLCLLTCSSQLTWRNAEVVAAYLEESMMRNVYWQIQASPELADPDAEDDDTRLRLSFQSSLVSARLLCFQAWFLNNIARPDGQSLLQVAAHYDVYLGRPNADEVLRFQAAVTDIKSNVASWPDLYQRIGVPYPPDMPNRLRNAVSASFNAGYHGGSVGVSGSSGRGRGRGGGGGYGRGGGGGRSRGGDGGYRGRR